MSAREHFIPHLLAGWDLRDGYGVSSRLKGRTKQASLGGFSEDPLVQRIHHPPR